MSRLIRYYTPYIILCTKRVGSNLMLSYLCSHYRIDAYNEIFNPAFKLSPAKAEQRDRDVIGFLKSLGYPWRKRIGAQGFKLFYEQAQEPQRKAIWPWLSRHKNIRVIHLEREDKLRSFLSWQIAERTGAWMKSSKKPGLSGPIELSPTAFLAYLIELKAERAEALRYFEGHKLLSVTYEQLTSNPEEVLGRVERFLGVPHQPMTTKMERQNPKPVDHYVANWDEFCEALKGTPGEAYLTAHK